MTIGGLIHPRLKPWCSASGRIDKEINASQGRLVLEYENNQVIDSLDIAYDLKTPSAQQSGVKILFVGSQAFKGNTAYTIKFALDPSFQVVNAGKRCLLKPVVKSLSIQEVEF